MLNRARYRGRARSSREGNGSRRTRRLCFTIVTGREECVTGPAFAFVQWGTIPRRARSSREEKEGMRSRRLRSGRDIRDASGSRGREVGVGGALYRLLF